LTGLNGAEIWDLTDEPVFMSYFWGDEKSIKESLEQKSSSASIESGTNLKDVKIKDIAGPNPEITNNMADLPKYSIYEKGKILKNSNFFIVATSKFRVLRWDLRINQTFYATDPLPGSTNPDIEIRDLLELDQSNLLLASFRNFRSEQDWTSAVGHLLDLTNMEKLKEVNLNTPVCSIKTIRIK